MLRINLSFLLVLFFMFIFITTALSEEKQSENVGKTLFEEKCTLCHDVDRPLSKKKTKEEWLNTVNLMRSKKIENFTEEEAKLIAGYLTVIREKIIVNKAKDPKKLTELEEKHIPSITLNIENQKKNYAEVFVEIGKIPHPMEKNHYIKSLELFLDDKSVGKINLNPQDKPEAKFNIKFVGGENIVVRAECNIHGFWEGNLR